MPLIVDSFLWSLLLVFLLSKLLAHTREPIMLDLVFSGTAALIGGIVWWGFGAAGFHLFTLLAAATAVILLSAGYKAVPEHEQPSTSSEKWCGWLVIQEPGFIRRHRAEHPLPETPMERRSLEIWEDEGGTPSPAGRRSSSPSRRVSQGRAPIESKG